MPVTIRKVYLYLATLIGLIVMLVGTIQLLSLVLRSWVFPKADFAYHFGPCYEPAPRKEGEDPKQLSKEECEKQREEERTSRRQSDAARSIAWILVGAPIYFYHWRKIKDERPE